jgi:hypothetical protein
MGLNISQPILQDLFYVAAAMQNGNYLQRLGIGSIYDQVRVDRKELHSLVRQIFAPMPGAGIFCQKADPVPNH